MTTTEEQLKKFDLFETMADAIHEIVETDKTATNELLGIIAMTQVSMLMVIKQIRDKGVGE